MMENAIIFRLADKFKIVFYSSIVVFLVLLSAMLIETFILKAELLDTVKHVMAGAVTGTFKLPTICNALLWIMIFILMKSREKMTYHNYAYVFGLLMIMYVMNNFLFIYYHNVGFAKSGYMVLLSGFFVALPLHEAHKADKKSVS